MPWYQITVYDLLHHSAVVLTAGAATQLAQRLLTPALSPAQVCILAFCHQLFIYFSGHSLVTVW